MHVCVEVSSCFSISLSHFGSGMVTNWRFMTEKSSRPCSHFGRNYSASPDLVLHSCNRGTSTEIRNAYLCIQTYMHTVCRQRYQLRHTGLLSVNSAKIRCQENKLHTHLFCTFVCNSNRMFSSKHLYAVHSSVNQN